MDEQQAKALSAELAASGSPLTAEDAETMGVFAGSLTRFSDGELSVSETVAAMKDLRPTLVPGVDWAKLSPQETAKREFASTIERVRAATEPPTKPEWLRQLDASRLSREELRALERTFSGFGMTATNIGVLKRAAARQAAEDGAIGGAA